MQSTDKSIKPLWDYFASLLLGIGLCFWIPRINVVFRLAGITTINQEMEETMSVLGGSLFLLGSLWITPRLVFWLGAQVRLAREVPGLHDEVKEQAQLLKLRAEAIEKERARVRRTIGLEIEAKERLALLLAGVHAHCNRMGSSLKFPVRTVSAARRECLLLLGPALKDADWRSIKPMERAKFWKGFFEEARQEALS